MSSSSLPRKISLALCAILVLLQTLQPASCQISDGDEQFEAVHQDIGRISGLAAQGSPQVAPKSALVARQPLQYVDQSQLVSPPAAASAAQAVASVFDRGASSAASQTRGRPAGAARKPNRITLVARRDPLPPTGQQTLTTVAQPALIAAQLPAPPQQLAAAPSLAQEQPSFTPSFAPLAPSEQPRFEQPPPPAQAAVGPALSSFRSASSQSSYQTVAAVAPQPAAGSVSARHSALMAQVAAERAAAASLLGNEPSASSGPAPLGLAPPEAPLASGQHHLAAPSHHLQQQHQQHQQQTFQTGGHLAAPTTAQGQSVFLPASEEPLVAPSFEHVLGHGCPHKGVFSWDNRDHCDRYYLCTNGTFTEEACPNGLAYSQQGAVYQHCAYNWNVDCGRKKTAEPIASPGCPWQFGLFPIVQAGRCSIDYYACEWGVPETKRCSPEGLFYDDRIKGCQWADQLGCKSEGLLNFKCPPEDEDNPYWPYPRYYHDAKDVIVCVNEQPRLVHCNEDQLVDPGSLACIDVNKKKKKF